MLTRVCESQNIRTAMRNLPPELDGVEDSFASTFESDRRGTLPVEVGSYFDRHVSFPNTKRMTELPDDLYALLQRRNPNSNPSRKALLQPYIDYRRAIYARHNNAEANSHVIIGEYPFGKWNAARITDIIALHDGIQSGSSVAAYDLVVAVQLFIELSEDDTSKDFYRAQKREFGVGCLFYKRTRQEKRLIRAEDIVCHFAGNVIGEVPGIGKHCIHVLPLYRVSERYSVHFY